ncbi:MAG: DUF547 domain-containing protein [Pseudomonadota bacterium]
MRNTIFTALTAVALLVSPATLTASADTVDTTEAAVSEQAHADWTEILAKYVTESADGVNRFDYGALKASAADSAALNAYIDSFASADLDALSRDEQYVLWVNAYNAVTVQHIIGRYPLRSIRSGYIIGPWKKVKTNVGGREISLNDIEHEVLRKDWQEPRTHYAVNCASYGCPNLKASAWEVATLEQDLTEAAAAYINHPRGVTVRGDGRLEVSTIYKWFKEDFGGNEAGVIDHLLEYAEQDLAEQISAKRDIRSYDYDWSLNDTE